jgi:hypothetical protein
VTRPADGRHLRHEVEGLVDAPKIRSRALYAGVACNPIEQQIEIGLRIEGEDDPQPGHKRRLWFLSPGIAFDAVVDDVVDGPRRVDAAFGFFARAPDRGVQLGPIA